MTIQERLKCVTPALATPLKKDGTFDPEGMTKLVKYVMSKGMTNIFVLGYARRSAGIFPGGAKSHY